MYDISIIKDLLSVKRDALVGAGAPPHTAMVLAQEELITQAGQTLSGMDLFCFRALLAGAARMLASEGAENGENERGMASATAY